MLDWQENLVEGEFPPDWMLPFDTELKYWFDEIQEKRKKRFSPDDDDDNDGDDDPLMMRNELAENRR